MSVISFSIKELKPLIEGVRKHELDGGKFSATSEMIWNGNNFEGGEPLDSNGKSESSNTDGLFWPSPKYIKPEVLVPTLQLVGDSGVYLISNMINPEGKSPSETGMICYAKKCNPHVDEDYYENKRELFGGDDGSVDIPISWAEWAIKSGKRSLRIRLNATSVALEQR